MEKIKNAFAANLYNLRTKKQMTQFELGAAINYSDKAVSRWERGEAIPDAYVLLQLAELFGVTVDYLLHEHADNEEAPVRKINFNVITSIVMLGVFTVALLAYVILDIFALHEWMIFVYALPIALITLLVLNTVWNNKKYNVITISLLVWSIIIALYLSFLAYMNHNWWLIFLVGIPAQIIVLLCFKIKIKNALDIFKK